MIFEFLSLILNKTWILHAHFNFCTILPDFGEITAKNWTILDKNYTFSARFWVKTRHFDSIIAEKVIMKTITYAGKDLYNLYSINIWFIFPRTTYNTNFKRISNFVFWVDLISVTPLIVIEKINGLSGMVSKMVPDLILFILLL